MLQQNKLLVDFLVIIHTAPVFRSVGPGSSLAGYTIALCLHTRDFCPLAPLYLRCVTGYLRHIMSRGEWSASAYRNWDERRVGALLWFPLYWIRYGDSKRWQGMKQDFVPVDINPFITHPAHERLYHTTRVYAPYSLRTAVWVILCPTRIVWKRVSIFPILLWN